MYGIKNYNIHEKEVLTGIWEEVNNEANVCNLCLQKNLKVYMIARGYWFHVFGLISECALVFSTRERYSKQNKIWFKHSL